jgi:dipeptidyl-peptidase 4
MRKMLLTLLLLPLLTLAQKKQISFDDVYRLGTFRSENVPGFRSMNNGKFYSEYTEAGLVKNNFLTGETIETIINAADVKDEAGKTLSLQDVEWNSDEKKLLIFEDREKIYRRSSKAIVYAYDIATKKTIKIDNDKILHATYSPDGNKVAYVKNNNLFFKDLISDKTTQVTKDGEWNKIINGNADWVYEEEFEFTRAFNWSKNGSYIAYYKFDESKVPQYTLAIYKNLYPAQYTYKYPAAGEPNSIVTIHTYNIRSGKDVTVNTGKETNVYIPRIKWTEDNDKLAVAWMNRLQNNLTWLVANANTGATSTMYDETNKYYIDINDDLKFLEDGKRFITTSEKDGYKHIYLYNLNGTLQSQLTKGKFDVDNVLGVDEKNKTVYFTAAYYSPMDRQLFSVSYAGNNNLIKQITKGAGFHVIDMNNDLTYYVDTYSDINTPPVIAIYDITGKQIKILKDNAALKKKMNQYAIGTTQFIRVPNGKGDTLNGWMLKPANFDPSKKYPLLFCNYGGPGSQQVINKWGATSFWHQYLSQRGYIIVSIDNTGTGFRGEDFKKKTYLHLGQLEIEDQINAAKYLGSQAYIDKKRIGHWGWSFGGFMSCLAITKGADVFKTAVAVAPVTDWRFYDNIYTERYMRTPQENEKGYEETAPINFVDRIKGKFLIIHGTADDNVHFQNSVTMIDRMIENNINFESAYYPNKNHSISGGNTTYHIYKKMTDFIFNNL